MDDNVTGRDGFIVPKALAYAVGAIQQLPAYRQETSDADDMLRILHATTDQAARELLAYGVQRHLGFKPNLEEMPEPADDYTGKEASAWFRALPPHPLLPPEEAVKLVEQGLTTAA